MAYIEKYARNGNKSSWRVQIRMEGFPPVSKSFRRHAAALEWAREEEQKMREGAHSPYVLARKKNGAELITKYEESVLSIKTDSEGYKENQRQQLSWWRRELGEYTVINITSAIIAEKRDKLLKQGLEPGTVNRYLSALSHVFTKAYKEWGWVPENPMPKVERLKEVRGRVRILEDKERSRLLKHLQNIDSIVYMFLWLALSTGARRDEIRLLKWKDVDFKRHRIILHDTKNGERRAVYFYGHAYELLKQAYKNRRRDAKYVFSARYGNQPISLGRLYYAWYKAVACARINDIRIHDARHSFASYMAAHGAGLNYLAELLGHKTLNQVKRYTHLIESRASSMVQEMNEQSLGNKIQHP